MLHQSYLFFHLSTEGQPHPEICEKCSLGVWRSGARLCFGKDNMRTFPQVGLCVNELYQ